MFILISAYFIFSFVIMNMYLIVVILFDSKPYAMMQ